MTVTSLYRNRFQCIMDNNNKNNDNNNNNNGNHIVCDVRRLR